VRRALVAAGFSVEKVSGCGGKKEALLGTFRGEGGGAE
jgi:tRNA U34 5-methylaminomethyl-2-thiouridine-forming methyltransferase MnmC